MPSPYDNRRDHVLREPLERAVAKAESGDGGTKAIVEAILLELDEQNLISYQPRGTVNLLTPAGRVLALLLDRPNLTVREMSVTLGCSTTSVMKALAMLDRDGLVSKTKASGRFEYCINPEKAGYHHDLRRLLAIVRTLA